jgi:hypothetical protein
MGEEKNWNFFLLPSQKLCSNPHTSRRSLNSCSFDSLTKHGPILYITFNVITFRDITLNVIGKKEEKDMAESGLNRFSDPSLLILASLAGGVKHGYAMMEDIEQFAGARLGPGTLYGALARLETQGLIEPLPAEERRRPYRLTGAGVVYLRQELKGLELFANLGLQRLASI